MKSLLALALGSLAALSPAADWPNWRGPAQDGSSPEKGLPSSFSRDKGVKWAADLPSIAASVPVVAAGKVFITAPITDKQELVALCFDAATGRELWRKVVSKGGPQWDNKSNLASPSATQWTYGSSPVLDGGKLYIQVLQRNETFTFQGFDKGTPGKDMSSYILALNPDNGQDLWKHIRPTHSQVESLESFSTPVFCDHQGKRLMLISGGDTLSIHDAQSGAEQGRLVTWNPLGEGYNKFFRLVPSPVVGDGLALVCAPKNFPVFAMDLSATGKDVKPLWESNPKEVTTDVSTPAFYEGSFYVLDSNRRTLSRVEPKTGRVLWTGETGSKSKFESSPTVADGKVYAINFWGDVYVMKAGGEKFEVLSVNAMGDGSKPNGDAASCRSSVAVANGCLFIRTQDKLFCIGQ